MRHAKLVCWITPILMTAALAGAGCTSDPAADPGVTGPVTDTSVVTDPPPTVVEPPVGNGFPCDVHAVLQASCASCHAGRLYYGPNFTSRDDLFLPARELFSVETKPIAPGSFGEHIAVSLRDRSMPPYGALKLPSDAERQLVIAWVEAGMPAGTCGTLTSQ
jgi:hypothetical protein